MILLSAPPLIKVFIHIFDDYAHNYIHIRFALFIILRDVLKIIIMTYRLWGRYLHNNSIKLKLNTLIVQRSFNRFRREDGSPA